MPQMPQKNLEWQASLDASVKLPFVFPVNERPSREACHSRKKPSGQRLRRSDSSPASLKSSEIALTLMKEAEALDLLAVRSDGLPS